MSKEKQKNQSKFTLTLKIMMVVLVIILLLFVAAKTFGGLTISSFSNGVSNYFESFKKGDGYPLSINSSMIKDANTLSSNLFLLTDTNMISLDSSAKTINSEQHTYTTPIMEINGSRAIIYDLDGKKFRVQTLTKTIHEDVETEKGILTATIGKKGNIAVATYSNIGSKSMITVYNKKLSKIFIWNCSDEYVVDISLSDSGKCMAAIAIGSSGGEIYSKLYVFDFDFNSEISTFEYPETSLFDVQFNGLSTIIVTGDNLRSVVTKKTEKGEDTSFGTATVSAYSVSENGTTAIVLSESGSVNSGTLYIYSKSNKLLYEGKLTENVKDMYCNDDYVTILFENEIITYNRNGRKVGNSSLSSDVHNIVLNGRKAYLIATNEIVDINITASEKQAS